MATIDRRGASLSAADPPIATNPNPDLAVKAPCRVATTANIILSGLQTIDGVTVAAGDRVLVKSQTDATTNGIYDASTGVWTRAIDNLNNSQLSQGTQVLVTQGAAFTNTLFSLTTANPIVLGTSAIMFASVNVPAVRKVNTTAPIAGGGSLAADLTITLTYGATFALSGAALQTAAGTGDVTWAQNSFATTIAAAAVTYAKMQNVTAARLLGNPTGGGASPSEITLGSTLAVSGAALQTGAGTGDVTWSVNSFAATVVKLQGRTLAATAPSDGQVLKWVAANSDWEPGTVSGTGTVINVATGTGLTGGPITTSGTVAIDPTFLQGFIGGLTLSNDGVAPNTVLDVASGVATDSSNAALIKIGALTKSTAGSWTSGSGNNGMGNGLTIAASTGYHVILANNGGTPDIYFDTSPTGANRPGGISDTKVRRIGSFRTDGSAHIIAFVQNGKSFRWSVPVQDISSVNPGTSAVTRTLASLPTGVKVLAVGQAGIVDTTTVNSATGWLLTDLATADTAPNATSGLCTVAEDPATGMNSAGVGSFAVWTNTLAQIRSRASNSAAGITFSIQTFGWDDPLI